MADDLDDLGGRCLRERFGGLAGGELAAVLHAAFDELVGLECLVGLLGHRLGDVGLSDEHHGVEVVREGAKRADLLTGECHEVLLSLECVRGDSTTRFSRQVWTGMVWAGRGQGVTYKRGPGLCVYWGTRVVRADDSLAQGR